MLTNNTNISSEIKHTLRELRWIQKRLRILTIIVNVNSGNINKSKRAKPAKLALTTILYYPNTSEPKCLKSKTMVLKIVNYLTIFCSKIEETLKITLDK